MALTETLKAISDPVRREILELLKSGSKNAGEIADHFSISHPAVSRHLSVLKEADLVRVRKDGRFIWYELNASVLDEVILWMGKMQSRVEEAKTDGKEKVDSHQYS